MADLSKQAIQAALACDWPNAIKLNLHLIKEAPDDVQALSRLAYAYLQSDNSKKAKSIYSKILKLDPHNVVATKNVLKLKSNDATVKTVPSNGQIYIDEPGTSRCVNLVNIAHKNALKDIKVGGKLDFKITRKKIELRVDNGDYVGSLADDLSFYIRRLCEKGNKYEVYVKEVTNNGVCVYIREIYRQFDSKKRIFNSLSSHFR